MYIVISPDTSFNGEFAGFKFKAGNCITKLDENLRLWFKMLGFKVEKYNKPEKKDDKPVNANETPVTEDKDAEENKDK